MQFIVGNLVVCPVCKITLYPSTVDGVAILTHGPVRGCPREKQIFLAPTVEMPEVTVRKLKAREVVKGWPLGRSTSRPYPKMHYDPRGPYLIAMDASGRQEYQALEDAKWKMAEMAAQCGLRLDGFEKGPRFEREEATQELVLVVNNTKVAACSLEWSHIGWWIARCAMELRGESDCYFRIVNVRP